MKVLLDECIDRRLAERIVGHDVATVPRKGWAGMSNGELLALAQVEFDAFVTVDRNLTSQQKLSSFDIGVVVLCAPSNRLADLEPLVSPLLDALSQCERGKVVLIESG